MSKWRGFPEIAGANIARDDRFAASDESLAEGSRSAIITRAGMAIGAAKFSVAQAAHGFNVGDVVRLDGTGAFTAATADTAANALVVGLVTEVIGTDDFTLQMGGHATGLTGLTAGSRHYLQDAGGLGTTAGTVEVPILDADATTSGWLVPLGAGGGSTSVAYDLVLGFVGQPASSDLDWLLAGRAVTIASADPGSAHARTNPAAAWTADIQKNGASVGSVEISTAGADTFTVASDISLAAGDRIEVVAPASADGSISDIQVTLKATVD